MNPTYEPAPSDPSHVAILVISDRLRSFAELIDANVAGPNQRAIDIRAAVCCLEGLERDRDMLKKRVSKLEAFAMDCRDNYDCDDDAHKHSTGCRCCMADIALVEEPSLPARTTAEDATV